jgi:hypothetical protein
MADIDYLLQPPARHFYEEIAGEVDRSHLDRAFRNICDNPDIDDEVKFALPIGKDRWLVTYSDGRFVIVYHHLNNWTLSILNISYAGEFWEPSDIPTVGPIL